MAIVFDMDGPYMDRIIRDSLVRQYLPQEFALPKGFRSTTGTVEYCEPSRTHYWIRKWGGGVERVGLSGLGYPLRNPLTFHQLPNGRWIGWGDRMSANDAADLAEQMGCQFDRHVLAIDIAFGLSTDDYHFVTMYVAGMGG